MKKQLNQKSIQGVDNVFQKKCVIYLRSAIKEKLIEQEKSIRIWAKKNNMLIVDMFYDTGLSHKRGGLNKMIGFLKKMKEKNEPIGFVLVSDMSRISRSRDMLELYNIAQTIKYLGAEICSIDNYLLDNSEIKLAKDIIMLIKDYENEDRRNRVKAGIQNKKLRLAQAF